MRSRNTMAVIMATTLLAACACSSASTADKPKSGATSVSPTAAASTASLPASSAAAGGLDGAVPKGPALKIGWISPISSGSALNFQAGMECYVKKNGGSVIATDAALQVNKQISDFDSLITQRVDGVAFLALDTKALNAPVQRAKAAKIATVEIDNTKSTAVSNVGEDPAAIGKAAAEAIGKQFPAGAKALVFKPAFPNPVLLGRYQGFLAAAAANHITVVGTAPAGTKPDGVSEGQTAGGALLTAHPEANAFYSFDGDLALGVGQAASEAGRKLAIYGVGASAGDIQGLKDGVITGIFDQDGYQNGLQAAVLLSQIVSGKTAAPVVMAFKTYTKANADTWVPAAKRCG